MSGIAIHAIVIGAGIGGLLTARVLADHYGHVTLLDRDGVAGADAPRRGVPQGHHAHGLLSRGREVLEQFFPGLTEELSDLGERRGDLGADCVWFNHGGCLSAARSGLEGLLVSRAMLEAYLRRRVLALPNLRLIERCDVRDLLADANGRRVTGVRARRAGGTDQTLAADLVVDAAGRGSRSPKWLAALGFARPEVAIDRYYTSRLYRRSPRQVGDKVAVVCAASPPLWCGAVALAQEGGRWIVSMGGYFGDHAPADEDGFLAFARTLPAGEIYDIAADSEPLSEFATFRFPSNLRRRYERLERFPEGYLVFGDALCSFNPVYGQGMTVAALQALALQRYVAHGGGGPARRFFDAAARLIDIPWQTAVATDAHVPGVAAMRGARERLIDWYMGKLLTAAHGDAALTTEFLKVANLMAAPPSLLRPAVALRVWRRHVWAAPRPISANRRALEQT